jgi:hypothetical protein
VFRDFDVFGIAGPPSEATAVLIVDPHTVLPLPVTSQRFQTIAGRNLKIGKGLRTIERDQAPKGDVGDADELFDPFAPE